MSMLYEKLAFSCRCSRSLLELLPRFKHRISTVPLYHGYRTPYNSGSTNRIVQQNLNHGNSSTTSLKSIDLLFSIVFSSRQNTQGFLDDRNEKSQDYLKQFRS
ncbi:hypothetical protein RRG08_067294 [Elysia crispata]|uniref:Uncharacterized protein n=1 Tax=Elysia crispata TaxID=231223 RepID=A0AAE1DCN9_9GAST|nr:hypothetical protein RRG08_067294 [Elysia crispata]